MAAGCALIDGHVHLHDCHEIDVALDAAAENFDRARLDLGLPDGSPAFLWLVEAGERGAERVLAHRSGRWTVDGSDGVSLGLVDHQAGRFMTAILGRQVRTAEDLEVLAIGLADPVPTNRPLRDTVEECLQEEALVMLPWGFGKWTGSRGRAVVSAFETYSSRGLRLADTAAHARFLTESQALARSIAVELPILAGSDPFPFRDQVTAIGRYGFLLDDVPPEARWEDLQPAVAALRAQPRRFGRPFGAVEFARLQWKMQLRKRFGVGRTA